MEALNVILDCPACGLEEHPHQTCSEANMSDEGIRSAMQKEDEKR